MQFIPTSYKTSPLLLGGLGGNSSGWLHIIGGCCSSKVTRCNNICSKQKKQKIENQMGVCCSSKITRCSNICSKQNKQKIRKSNGWVLHLKGHTLQQHLQQAKNRNQMGGCCRSVVTCCSNICRNRGGHSGFCRPVLSLENRWHAHHYGCGESWVVHAFKA